MNKLCDCKKQFIRERVKDAVLEIRAVGDSVEEEATEITEEIAKIVESECVCSLGTGCPHETKESNSIPLTYEVDTVGRLLKQCPTCYVKYTTKLDDSDYKEEKKECEHAPADVKQGWVFNSLTSYPLWLCKCGLVTCKNPNE